MNQDWLGWHDNYDDPRSPLAVRLAIVQDETRQAIARRPAGAVRLVSLCAGQGRDVVGALDGHPRQADVTAVLLEVDPENVAQARTRAGAAGLANVLVIQADASLTDAYLGYLPADILLICGLFGNISDADIRRTIMQMPRLCGTDAVVIWTRNLGRRPDDGGYDLTPTIRDWFREAGCREVGFRTASSIFGVGIHQLVAPPQPCLAGTRLFTFVGHGPR